jgi:transcriptional regulator with XRE-family HTH domain
VDSGYRVQERAARAGSEPGAEVRRARMAGGLTLAQLGERTGYSAAQVSRFERGLTPLNDIAVLWLFADALAIPSQVFGLTPRPPAVGDVRAGSRQVAAPLCAWPLPWPPRANGKAVKMRCAGVSSWRI